jgi:hypothetical protein
LTSLIALGLLQRQKGQSVVPASRVRRKGRSISRVARGALKAPVSRRNVRAMARSELVWQLCYESGRIGRYREAHFGRGEPE